MSNDGFLFNTEPEPVKRVETPRAVTPPKTPLEKWVASGWTTTPPPWAKTLAPYMAALNRTPAGLTDREACELGIGTFPEVQNAIANRDVYLVIDDGERDGQVVRKHVRNVSAATYEVWMEGRKK